MTDNQSKWKEIDDAFKRVFDLPAVEREAALEKLRGSDEEIYREVISLLKFHDSSEDFLKSSAVNNVFDVMHQKGTLPDEPLPDHIGPYRIVKLIGKGGMGSVYHAIQEKPHHRDVALKVVHVGMSRDDYLARFRYEHQALAMMSHPNIAHVYDAGTTDDGRPFFTMEFIPGVPVTAYCDISNFSLEERLRLFLQVCDGVLHAHRRGIIHRDLKPSNVLVTIAPADKEEQENTLDTAYGVPKIIDFGIAKEITATGGDHQTVFGMLLGTPAYMSPEQAEGEQLDTAADVFALGMILYEILCGHLPLDKEEYDEIAPTKLIRLMRERDMPKPSSRIDGLGARAETIAEKRVTKPESLRKKLAGDLDSIVMKAIKSDRVHRYPSVMAFATDIRNYLENRPVKARRTSRVYLLRKFIRRHPGGFALTVAALIAVGAFISYQRVQQQLAIRKGQVTAAYDNIEGILASFDSREESYTDDPIEKLKIITSTLDEIGAKDVQIAKLRLQLGYCFNIYGEHSLSRQEFQKAYDTYSRKKDYKEKAIESNLGIMTANVRNRSKHLNQKIFDQAIYEIEKLDASTEKKQLIMNAKRLNADWLKEQGIYLEAQDIYNLIYDNFQTAEDKLNEDALIAMNNLGLNLMLLGDWKEASIVMKETYELRNQFYASMNAYTWSSMHNLALIYVEIGDKEKAATFAQKAYELAPSLFIPSHKEIFNITVTLSLVRLIQGNEQEAKRLLESAYPQVINSLGEGDKTTWRIQNNLASVYSGLGRYTDALRVKEEELAFRDKHKPRWREKDDEGLFFLLTLGEIYFGLENQHKALDLGYLSSYIGLSKLDSRSKSNYDKSREYLEEALGKAAKEVRKPLIKQHLEQIRNWEQENGKKLTEPKALLKKYVQ